MRAANKGIVAHGKTPRVFYIFSGLLHYSGFSWSYVKDLYLKPFYRHSSCSIVLFSFNFLSFCSERGILKRDYNFIMTV